MNNRLDGTFIVDTKTQAITRDDGTPVTIRHGKSVNDMFFDRSCKMHLGASIVHPGTLPGSRTVREGAAELLRRFKDTAELSATFFEQCQFLVKKEKEPDGGQTRSARQALGSLLPELVAAFEWGVTGFPHFELTPDFFYAIALTDFGDVADEPLKLPFPAFSMGYPQNKLLPGVKLMVSRLHSWDEFGVNGRVPLSEYQISFGDPVVEGIRWPISKSRREFAKADFDPRNNQPEDPDELVIEPRMARGMTREEAIADWRAIGKRAELAQLILSNFLTYIETNGPLPSERTRGGVELPLERLGQDRPTFRVGRPIKLPNQVHEALKSGTSIGQWKLAQRFIVRGHWRNQVYGPERSLRRRQWIQPHWKGPATFAEAVERTYSVE